MPGMNSGPDRPAQLSQDSATAIESLRRAYPMTGAPSSPFATESLIPMKAGFQRF